MKRWLLPLVVLVGVLSAWRIQSSSAQAPKEAAAGNATIEAFNKECSGKIVVVLGAEDGQTTPLANATLRDVAGSRYLQGTYEVPEDGFNAALKGTRNFIHWDLVKEFMLLTPEEYQRWVESSKKDDAEKTRSVRSRYHKHRRRRRRARRRFPIAF
jgi:hypothetical protein